LFTAKALDKGDGLGCGLRALQSRLFDQKCGIGAVGNLQNWRDQVRMSGEQKPQRDGKRQHPKAHLPISASTGRYF